MKQLHELDQASANVTEADVAQLGLKELESISIKDISALKSNKLKDLLNVALSERLAHHLGGTYTSSAPITIAASKCA